jgi:hypothetical protein
MEEAVNKNSDAAFLTYGEYLLTRDYERAKSLIQKGFETWHSQFQSDCLHKNNYSRLISAARQLGRIEVAEEVKRAQNSLSDNNTVKWYNEDNLISDNKIYLPEIIQ